MKPIIAIFYFFSISFIASVVFAPYPLSFVIKSIPIFALAFLMAKQVRNKTGILLTVGLLFSATGDIFLDLDRTNYFVQGLGSFLLAHLIYTVAFVGEAEITRERIPRAIGVVLFTILVGSRIFPALGDLKIPVSLYVFFISLMGVAAAFLRGNSNRVFFGACLFIFSDSVIAVNKFLTPVPFSTYLIMITYYGAQYNIAMGMMNLCASNRDQQ
ncbi:MAG: lysoplasmalogenase [Proteobacteria bacterium]|nr:lysoplasmalogenase [Pseudomonadota bacterium]